VNSDQDLLGLLRGFLRHAYYGKYRGTVVEVDAETLKIRAMVPAVLGDKTPSGWCMPCVPYAGKGVGLFLIPDPGARVWIEFEGGELSNPIWSGCYWEAGELPSDAAPTTRGLVTSGGHKLLFDDNAQSITLTDASENTVELESAGISATRGSQSVKVSDGSVSVNDGAVEVV
jgi:uncharacterized protein involved in type VI secretion and phage assembly